jgi:hypothetical protein
MDAYSPAVENVLAQLTPGITESQFVGIVNRLSVAPSSSNAIVYFYESTYANGQNYSNRIVAQSIAAQTGASIIDNTDRAMFLNDPAALRAVIGSEGSVATAGVAPRRRQRGPQQAGPASATSMIAASMLARAGSPTSAAISVRWGPADMRAV